MRLAFSRTAVDVSEHPCLQFIGCNDFTDNHSDVATLLPVLNHKHSCSKSLADIQAYFGDSVVLTDVWNSVVLLNYQSVFYVTARCCGYTEFKIVFIKSLLEIKY